MADFTLVEPAGFRAELEKLADQSVVYPGRPASATQVYHGVPGVGFYGTQNQNTSGSRNRIIYEPFTVSHPIRIDRVFVAVNTGTSGVEARLGVYTANLDQQPEDLVFDAGIVDMGTSGQKEVIVDEVLPTGRYVSARWQSSGGVTLRAWETLGPGLALDASTALLQQIFAEETDPVAPFPASGIPWDEGQIASTSFRYIVRFRWELEE